MNHPSNAPHKEEMIMQELLQEFADKAFSRPPELKARKAEGKKIVECVGSFIPQELVYAAGAEPYLMCRGGEPEPTDAALQYMLRFLNPFAKSLAGYYLLGIDPVTPIADLIITQQKDCHIARISELMEYLGLPIFKVGVPPDWEKDFAFEYYLEALHLMKARLEELTGEKVTEEKILAQVQATNTIHELLRKIDELRDMDNPPLGGYDFIRMNHYSFNCEPKIAVSQLTKILEKLSLADGAFSNQSPRVLLAGHIVAVGDYVVPKLIEESGGVVVAEMLDEGIRDFRGTVEPTGDILRNIAERLFLQRIPPSVFQPAWKKRFDYMETIIHQRLVDGVVWYQLSFDEIYDMEAACMSKWLSDLGIPFLKLESSYEYSREHMGPLTTRVESFIEAIREQKG